MAATFSPAFNNSLLVTMDPEMNIGSACVDCKGEGFKGNGLCSINIVLIILSTWAEVPYFSAAIKEDTNAEG